MSLVFLALSCLMLVYVIAGYPFFMLLFAYFYRQQKPDPGPLPSLSIIVCAKNEEDVIGERLENLLSLDYPEDQLEIIVVSDGSTDRTDQVVEEYRDNHRVRLVRNEISEGKAVALNRGATAARNEILLMGDARQNFASNAAKFLVSHFNDPKIGVVSGRLMIQPQTSSRAGKGVGSYWEYEVLLRKAEARSGSVIGVTGAIYAIRKEVFEPIPAGTILDDVLIPMQAILKGSRVIFDERGVAYDRKKISDTAELTRKVRTLYGNLQLLKIRPELLSIRKNPVWLRFISHKILRLFLPFLFILCFVSSLLAGGVFLWFGIIQLAFWLVAVISINSRKNNNKVFQLAAGLLLLNIAVVLAWYKFLKKDDQVWIKSTTSMQ